MKWAPNQPIVSTITPRLSVHDYLTDLAFDFKVGDLVLEDGDLKTVSGLENFIQKVQKFILTPKTPRWPYGFDHRIFEATTEDFFQVEAESLARQLVSQVLEGYPPGSINGLGHTIEAIYSIENFVKDEKTYLQIEMKVTGLNDILKVTIPYPKSD